MTGATSWRSDEDLLPVFGQFQSPTYPGVVKPSITTGSKMILVLPVARPSGTYDLRDNWRRRARPRWYIWARLIGFGSNPPGVTTAIGCLAKTAIIAYITTRSTREDLDDTAFLE